MIGKFSSAKKKKYDITIKCPSCGKSVPKGRTCRECGAQFGPKGRIKLSRIYLSMIFLGIIGLIFLSYAYYNAIAVTPIDDVYTLQDGDNVRISGMVIDIEYDDRYEKTSFTVKDSSGEIEVFGWSDFTSDIIEEEYIPSIGDNITVEGTVSIWKDTRSIEVGSADSFEIIWRDEDDMLIGDILLKHLYDKVVVRGFVEEVQDSYFGTSYDYVILTLTDYTGEIRVYISGDQIALADKYAIIPEENQTVEITGMVTEYKGQLEIIPSSATSESIEIIGVPIKEWETDIPKKKAIPGYDPFIFLSIIFVGVSFFIFIIEFKIKKIKTSLSKKK
jgi:DNA/RNA endonuclease YhcR with UshA esterase domain/ribosomal protein L32